MTDFAWGHGPSPLYFHASQDVPASVGLTAHSESAQRGAPAHRARQAMVEVLAVGEGRGLTNVRTLRTAIGDRLRYTGHTDDDRSLEIHQHDAVTGIEAITRFEQLGEAAAYRVSTTLVNHGNSTVRLQAVSTVSLGGLTRFLGPAASTRVWSARNEWCSENRWYSHELTGRDGLPDINAPLHLQAGRGMIEQTGTSTWSSGGHLPVSALTNTETGHAVVWQIEVNGPWRWEINSLYDQQDWIALALMGPTDLHHAWTTDLEPGGRFTSVPASFALSATSFDDAMGELTEHRRLSHLPVGADAGRPLVFNDYMNALMGDPTTERLLPLIDAAAALGADCFCIDAGWYDDGGDWWPSVGAWEPSTGRFGDLGLTGVLEYIRDAGMKPGLWVEPEVIGVRSPKASQLPEECFMRRGSTRIVEHDRFFLDLRSEAARGYLDEVFRRLVEEYGAEYFKWDYNVTPGSGPDTDATGPGEGLLDHARAHLTWFEGLRQRYPDVIFEACSSGAQRQDGAILRLYDLQSTSDQQDYRLYAPIAAAAPTVMPMEQAGNWAYPQAEMSAEQIAFTLVNGLSGRLYLSGNIDTLDPDQTKLVREAADLYREIVAHHVAARPTWPLGLPGWTDPVVALGSQGEQEMLLFVWVRDDATSQIDVPLERFANEEVSVETVFPAQLPPWPVRWEADTSCLHVDLSGHGESARVFRIRRTAS